MRRFTVDGLCRQGENGFGNEMKPGIDSRFGPHYPPTGKAFLSNNNLGYAHHAARQKVARDLRRYETKRSGSDWRGYGLGSDLYHCLVVRLFADDP